MERQTISDEALLARLREGNREAYAEIYQRYVVSLVGFVETKLYSLEEARDVVQELFVELWEKRTTVMVHSSVKAYLFAAARHRTIDQIRRNLLHDGYAERLRQLSPAYRSIEEELDARELERRLEGRLEGMSDTMRQIFRMSRKEGKSNAEIAQSLQLSEQTVKNNISKVLKELRNTIRTFIMSFI